ncbi:MAG: D-alanine--D-alanine ligase [Anaerolineae bacterium]|nr:D-alanine--D-alanine ligase [Anaerolineae bacterium]
MNNTNKIDLVVIYGGRSGEHEVSLLSSRSVLDAINKDRYNITEVGITHDGQWLSGENTWEALNSGNTHHLVPVTLLPVPGSDTLFAISGTSGSKELKPLAHIDVVLPILHGTYGEDGTLQGLLEMADLAYVGAGVLGSSVGMDKGIFKDVMRAHDIPVPNWVVASKKDIQTNMDAVIDRGELVSRYPLFVKPANLGSSVGVTKCKNRSDLFEGLLDAVRFDRRVLVEQGINAREIEVSVLGNDQAIASLPGEICPRLEFYSYRAKYIEDSTELLIPAPLDEKTIKHIQTLAIRAYQAIDCAGMARVDFLMDRDSGEVYINELNTIPGFTSISMYPKLWENSGIPYPELIDRLIDLALERRQSMDGIERSYGEMHG